MTPKITHKLFYRLIASFIPFFSLVSLPLAVFAISPIPTGCPGSTQQGPVASTPTNCPYSNTSSSVGTVNIGSSQGKYPCGGPGQEVYTSINIGCVHKGNPIMDALFAIIRVLSIGVGFAIVAGLVIAAIQFIASSGDPQLRAKAISRIHNVVIALLVFIFAYAILNYVIPAGFFK